MRIDLEHEFNFYGKCNTCPYAEWDYETFYGSTAKQWFICGCNSPVLCCSYEDPEKEEEDD